MKMSKRVRQKEAGKEGKGREGGRPFLFYIHEISCPPLYFIASQAHSPLTPSARRTKVVLFMAGESEEDEREEG